LTYCLLNYGIYVDGILTVECGDIPGCLRFCDWLLYCIPTNRSFLLFLDLVLGNHLPVMYPAYGNLWVGVAKPYLLLIQHCSVIQVGMYFRVLLNLRRIWNDI